MHYLYFVRLRKERADSAEKAMALAQQELDRNGFCAEGYFVMSRCNWYAIGGRWSGVLQELAAGFAFLDEVKKQFGLPDSSIPLPWAREHDRELQALWESLGASGRHSWARVQYGTEEADDAMPITATMLKGLKKGYFREVGVFDPDAFTEYPASALDESAAGDWLVVVDYQA
jgi:hypothetical protein